MNTTTSRKTEAELIEVLYHNGNKRECGPVALAHDKSAQFWRVTKRRRFRLTLPEAFDLFVKLMADEHDCGISIGDGDIVFFAAIRAALSGRAPACSCQAFTA